MSGTRPPAAINISMQPPPPPTKKVLLEESFKAQGVVALPHLQKFAIFGGEAKHGGQIRYCDLQGNFEAPIKTLGQTVWHATTLPDSKLFICTDNKGDHPENKATVIRYQRVAGKKLEDFESTHEENWVPALAFNNNPKLIPADTAIKFHEKAWRINLKGREIEQHRDLIPNKCFPVPTSSQYFAFSPNGKYVIAGNMVKDQVGLRQKDAKAAFTIPVPVKKIDSDDFRAAMWFSDGCPDGCRYAISMQDSLLIGDAIHRKSTRNYMHAPVHAMAAIAGSAVLITSHQDGSIQTYDAKEVFKGLEQKKENTPAAGKQPASPGNKAPAPSLIRIGLFSRPAHPKGKALIDIATISNEHETVLAMYERGTQAVEYVTIKHSLDLVQEIRGAKKPK